MDQSPLDLNDLLGQIADSLIAHYAFEGCSIALWDADAGVLANRYARLPERLHEMENTYRSFRFQANETTIAGLAFVQQAPQVIDAQSVGSHSQTIQDVYHRWGFATFAAWPIIHYRGDGRQQVIGVFSGFYQNARVGPEMRDEIALRLAAAAASIERLLDQEQFEVLDPDLAVQHQLVSVLTESNRATTLAASADPLCAYLMQRFGFDMAAVLVPQGDMIEMRYSVFTAPHAAARDAWAPHAAIRYTQDVTDGLPAVVYAQNTHFMVDDVQGLSQQMFPAKDRTCLDALKTVHSFLLLPIREAGRPIGVLWLLSLGQPVVLGEGELATLQLLADFLGSNMQRLK